MERDFQTLMVPFCRLVVEGKHKEAEQLLLACRAKCHTGPEFLDSLSAMLKAITDREQQLADVIVELASLKAEQENGFKRLEGENKSLRNNLDKLKHSENLPCRSQAILRVFQQAERIADTQAIVLITGETGTGKSFLAKNIHFASGRAHNCFVGLNCAAIPESLLESELFGIEKGVASGVNARMGYFEQASGGTLFLDEIGDMPLNCQSKILKALESGAITRVGGRRQVPVDVRLVTATHKDLEKACEVGEFRPDLYYRLNVIRLHIPPLRERREDIPPLAAHFLNTVTVQYRLGEKRLTPEASKAFASYLWPGNLRELKHEIERAALLTTTDTIGLEDLSPPLLADAGAQRAQEERPAPGEPRRQVGHPLQGLSGKSEALARKLEKLSKHPDLVERIMQRMAIRTSQVIFSGSLPRSLPSGLEDAIDEMPSKEDETPFATSRPENNRAMSLEESARALILQTLEQCANNKARTARLLGLSREGLRKKMKRLGIWTPSVE